MSKGTLFTVSAPSGAGKTTLVKAVIQRESNLVLSISHTTRPQRPGEIDGVDYFFVNEDEFNAMAQRGAFLEYAKVYGNLYGTARSSVENALSSGNSMLLEIDWQGAAQVRRLMPESVSIFILPPSREVLEQRLQKRGQDAGKVIAQRMAAVRDEISHYAEADFIVVNDDFERAVADLLAVVRGEREKGENRSFGLTSLIRSLMT